ncbi:ABC transporter ATP-binding protein [Candidatus Woesearchaeota archaeon]|nr:ABC transporter ATP-binding protein [Candidatus Woesearchaeota archaeon]
MITAENLKKSFFLGAVEIKALKGISLEIKKGEFVGIMGPSGSGKSTLLHMLALLDDPTSGEIIIDKQKVLELNEEAKIRFRLKKFGYVFQEYALLPELTALENIFLPAMANGHDKKYCMKAGLELLKKVNLFDRANHLPSELSGGQQQRVAIARGLVNNPKILFADEPCANLDTESSKSVLDLFRKLNKDLNQTIVMVTHENWHKKYLDRIVWLRDGVLDKGVR